jgi:tRNA threonylcarbamoyladenosine biosynthesis protein TsaB
VLILGIDTATQQVGCAIGGHEGVIASFHSARGRRHAEVLAPGIEFVCRQSRHKLHDMSAVAVDIGPGLFTGLRVGVATAKAIAHALRVPMIGVSSLDLLAFPVRYSSRRIVALIDARRGEIYYAFYRQVPGGVQRISDYLLGSPDDVANELMASRDECLVVGDGSLRYTEILSDVPHTEIGEPGLAYPTASSLVQLAHARALREEFVNPWELQPLYLRKSDAEISWEARGTA